MKNLRREKNSARVSNFIMALCEIAQHELIVVPPVAFCLAMAFGGAA
ncbi:hypothetical protein ACPWZ5_23590 [Ralstonia pseudosolanacearum]